MDNRFGLFDREPGLEAQLRFVDRIAQVAVNDWDRLAGSQPFLRHAFFLALEQTGCVGAASGWLPHYALLEADGQLMAAMPLYLKQHSWGEYVFDWAWADASQRAGIPYYPKLLAAIPFTPVPGTRVLAMDDDWRRRLLAGVLHEVRVQKLSGFHCLLPAACEGEMLVSAGLLHRRGVQFHWQNRQYADYEAFLAGMTHDKRKKLRQERRRVAEAGVAIVRKTGAAITVDDWQFFAACYAQTYREHRSSPYLNEAFFLRLGETLGEHCLLVLASRAGTPIAAALNLFDEHRLYGRYWGACEFVSSLHFELCYHQGIEFAIERGLHVFEGGAQGEHKLSRGFEAVETHSYHLLAHRGLRDAVGEFLQRESSGIAEYLHELDERKPFRDSDVMPIVLEP